MTRIFHQIWKLYPKTSRLIAAEILLDNEPSPMDFINILLATRELEPEMSRVLLSRIQNILHSHQHPTRYCAISSTCALMETRGTWEQITVGTLFSVSHQWRFQTPSADMGKAPPFLPADQHGRGRRSSCFSRRESFWLWLLPETGDWSHSSGMWGNK